MTLPLQLPLRGSQLIEASAGTGKTHTIAMLYVRLVLGHSRVNNSHSDGSNGFHRPLVPPEILVVTFTESASLELRERIRTRLVETARAFRMRDISEIAHRHDPLLTELLADYPREDWPRCARQLEVAADWMDEAAIATIHSWSQKMLKTHAFDSARLFRQTLVQDLTSYLHEAVTDYWRTRVYPLSAKPAAAAVDIFESPAALLHALQPLLQRQDAALVHAGDPLEHPALTGQFQTLADTLAQRDAAEALARERFRADASGIVAKITALRKAMNGTVFRGVSDDALFEQWLTQLHDWAQGSLDLPEADFVQKLAPQRFKLKKPHVPPETPFFLALQQWHTAHGDALEQRARLKPLALADARAWVAGRVDTQLRERGELGFADMIRGLADALANDHDMRLASRIREQFPVAMIDEFQDTDAQQYCIFDRIYRIAENDPNTALILIGDPKQAIYGFRGGDIHTYLTARAATAGRIHTLTTNFRSSAAAVAAVNHLFAHAETRHARKAFRFAGEHGNPLPFQAVDANGRGETLLLDQEAAPGIIGSLIGTASTLNKREYLEHAARHCANRIAAWLDQAGDGTNGFLDHDTGAFRPLQARDIAVLVRDRTEATAIREALGQCGLHSVYLSDRESVFATDEAKDMLHWLEALARPDNASLLRAALATPTLARSLDELDQIHRDELVWEYTQERFTVYRECWHQLGILPALRRLMHEFSVPERLAAQPDGARRLTNVLQLGEWAQQVSERLDGEHALIRLLREHIHEPGREEQVLRLESDADLIQVVTIFKSKGLEYPLVVLPFVCTAKPITGKHAPLYHHNGTAVIELGNKTQCPEAYQHADDERLSEDMRLLYVALTRARHTTLLAMAPLATGTRKHAMLEHSALGYLLAGGEPIPDHARLQALWRTHCEQCNALAHEDVSTVAAPYPYAAETHSDERPKPALEPAHHAFTPWWIASYSALERQAPEAPENPQTEIRSEEHVSDASRPLLAETALEGMHAFARGPEPGTFLHGLIETCAEHGFHALDTADDLWSRLQRRCQLHGWQDDWPALQHMLRTLASTPLAPPGEEGPVLGKLRRYRAEPEFWFATHHAQSTQLDTLVRTYILRGHPRPALAPAHLNGLMKGFIDLLVEHEGRFYVIDWKSNWLGTDDTAYRTESMQQTMLDKRYDAQLALYLLALHRHLQQTLHGYDYEAHVGGAMLVYLRGLGAPSRGIQALKPPREFIEALDAAMAGHEFETASNVAS